MSGTPDYPWIGAFDLMVEYEQTILTELLFKAGNCVGAVLFQVKSGEWIVARAKATILATGG